MSERAEKVAVAALLASALLLFSLYSISTPLFEASDELWHYPLVQHLATTGILPVQRSDQTDADAPWRQEGSQPPLYYVIAAVATAPFDSSNWRELRHLNPHSDMGRPTSDGNANAVIHSPAEQFPWTGAALTFHIARLVSVVFSTLTVLFVYLAARELFPRQVIQVPVSSTNADTAPASIKDDRAWLRLGVMVFTACVPMFAFISGSVNNDNAAAMFATLGLWWALRLARMTDTSIRAALVAGLITSAAALSKSSTLGLVGLFALAALCAGVKHWQSNGQLTRAASDVFRFTVIMGSTILILAGWWFIRNQHLYGDLLGWNAFLDAVGRRAPPASLAQLWSEREGFVWAYWGVFGTLNVILPPVIYGVLDGMAVVALIGIGWSGARRVIKITHTDTHTDTHPRLAPQSSFGSRTSALITQNAPLILCLTWVAITFAGLLQWTSLTPASQGRLMFPCIAVIAAAIAFGLYYIHRALLWISALGLALLAFAVPFAIIAPAYAKPPALAEANPARRLNVTFGNALDLVGYDQPMASMMPGNEATLRLYWHAQQPLDRNYSIFVHLINEDNVIIGQRDMYPGQGALATSELASGFAWSDFYAVRVSHLTLAPQKLRWAVGVYDLITGQRLTVTQGTDTEEGIVFGQTELTSGQESSVLLDYGNGIQLVRYDVEPRILSANVPVTVTLRWHTTRKVDSDYTVSLQLLDDKANKIAQNDSSPAAGNAPTSSWTAAAPIDDIHVLQVAKDAGPGVYRLLIIMYQPRDFSRLGAYDERGQFINTEVELMRLRVK